jgi:enamine deaminase RidA (YjgF/YER057c/UK114 family)
VRPVPGKIEKAMRYKPAIAWFVLLAATLIAGKKKNPDDITQTLELPKDPPAVAVAETRRLVFHVSPLSGKGLLTQQTRDALHGLLKANGGTPVVHIRAFVAGSGDIRRVPQIVSEVFTEKKLPLPSVSVVLAGGLPLDNAQVVLESISVAKHEVNGGGLAFVAGEPERDADPGAATRPLLDRALAKLDVQEPLLVTCFVSAMTDPGAIAGRFPSAAIDLVQTQRAPYAALAQCEAVTRGSQVTAARLAFTGTQVAFGAQQKDATLAFQRLDRELSGVGADVSGIVMTNVYPLSRQIAEMVRKLRPAAAPMAFIPFEGLASIDAGFAVDSVAAVVR